MGVREEESTVRVRERVSAESKEKTGRVVTKVGIVNMEYSEYSESNE